MLGNIRYIGELFKQKMLTEKIMHECVIKLLGDVKNPDLDEVECLCKLLTSIGKLIDHQKAKAHMDEYFSRIKDMSTNEKLPLRVRFMLQEVIELRRGHWNMRKPEPKPSTPSDSRGGGGGGRIERGGGDVRKEMGRGGLSGRGPATPARRRRRSSRRPCSV